MVANRLKIQAVSKGYSEFTILLGDNFYPKGVRSVQDDQFELFSRFSRSSEKFFIIPGNHDYKTQGSVDAQIAYSQVNNKWIFPNRYYSRIEKIYGPADILLCLVFLDTVTFAEDTEQQEWLKTELTRCNTLPNSLKIVSGHFPVYTRGSYALSKRILEFRNAVNPILVEHKVHAYLSAHEHQMQAFVADGIHYLIVGSVVDAYPHTHDVLEDILQFQAIEAGFINFYFEPSVAITKYSFIRADNGARMYSDFIDFRPVDNTPTGSLPSIGKGPVEPVMKTESLYSEDLPMLLPETMNSASANGV